MLSIQKNILIELFPFQCSTFILRHNAVDIIHANNGMLYYYCNQLIRDRNQ